MFDDPKKALRRMEEALLEEEETEEGESLSAQIGYADAGWMEETEEFLQNDEPREPETGPRRKRRNDAVDFHRTVYADEEMDENAAVFVEKKKRKKDKKQDKKNKKKKRPGCLSVLLLAELAAIGAVIWWWMEWIS